MSEIIKSAALLLLVKSEDADADEDDEVADATKTFEMALDEVRQRPARNVLPQHLVALANLDDEATAGDVESAMKAWGGISAALNESRSATLLAMALSSRAARAAGGGDVVEAGLDAAAGLFARGTAAGGISAALNEARSAALLAMALSSRAARAAGGDAVVEAGFNAAAGLFARRPAAGGTSAALNEPRSAVVLAMALSSPAARAAGGDAVVEAGLDAAAGLFERSRVTNVFVDSTAKELVVQPQNHKNSIQITVEVLIGGSYFRVVPRIALYYNKYMRRHAITRSTKDGKRKFFYLDEKGTLRKIKLAPGFSVPVARQEEWDTAKRKYRQFFA